MDKALAYTISVFIVGFGVWILTADHGLAFGRTVARGFVVTEASINSMPMLRSALGNSARPGSDNQPEDMKCVRTARLFRAIRYIERDHIGDFPFPIICGPRRQRPAGRMREMDCLSPDMLGDLVNRSHQAPVVGAYSKIEEEPAEVGR